VDGVGRGAESQCIGNKQIYSFLVMTVLKQSSGLSGRLWMVL
jgi:hypothetical protein